MEYTRKQFTVEARQYVGPKLIVTSALKGEQVAHDGDFLIIDPIAVQAIRDRELAEELEDGSLGNRGTVYVISKTEFLEQFGIPLALEVKKPFSELSDEEKSAAIYPTWDGIVTASGKTQEQLDAEVATS